MKKLLLLLKLFCSSILFFSTTLLGQNPVWTWMSGANSTSQTGTYGVLGVTSPINVPGARVNGINWNDAHGNLWLFGGQIGGGQTNDLWKYDVATNQWTWMNGADTAKQKGVFGIKGVAANTNKPGARYQLTNWKDVAGNFWMFGGNGYANAATGSIYGGYLNDLWKYNPITNQWTWVNGDTINNTSSIYGNKGVADSIAKPGGRDYTASWVDTAGNVWVFGGTGLKGYLNDLWKYNPVTNQWACMSGDTLGNRTGTYGIMGIADSTSKPGGRADAACWYAASGNCLWLFGGWGYDANGGTAVLNDLWKYDIATNRWTWIKGSNINGQTGVYGSFGVAASTNIPGARSGSRSFKDNSGMLFLFGGSTGTHRFNDIWKYNVITNQWTWVNGSNTANQYGIYATQGVPAATNRVGARYGDNVWANGLGDLWIFGGNAFATAGPAASSNDLWKLNNYILSDVSSIENNNAIFVYPNPNNGDFIVKLNEISDKTTIEIYNASGQKVFSKQTQTIENTINLQSQANGIYLIKIVNHNKIVSSSKILKK